MTQISELTGIDPDTKRANTTDIYNFRQSTDTLRPTGYLPSFIDSLVEKKLIELDFLYENYGELSETVEASNNGDHH